MVYRVTEAYNLIVSSVILYLKLVVEYVHLIGVKSFIKSASNNKLWQHILQ